MICICGKKYSSWPSFWSQALLPQELDRKQAAGRREEKKMSSTSVRPEFESLGDSKWHDR